MRRLRNAQRVLLGGGRSDLVDFAVSLQGADRRPAPRRRRDRRRALAGRPPGRRLADEHRRRPLRRLRGHGRPPVRVVRVPRRQPHRHGRDRDPGPRLRAPVREGARPGPRADRTLPRGAGGGRARHGPLEPIRAAKRLLQGSSRGQESTRWIPDLALGWNSVATGSRPECKLRAAERVFGAAGARARLEGEGGGAREPPQGTALRDGHLRLAARDPARPVRPGPARDPAEDLAPCALRPRRLALRLLRHLLGPADARPRRSHARRAASRSGRTSSPPARRATCARATGCSRTRGCTCSGRRGRRRRCSSSTWRRRRSRKSGSSTCRARRPPPSVAFTCDVCGETHAGTPATSA